MRIPAALVGVALLAAVVSAHSAPQSAARPRPKDGASLGPQDGSRGPVRAEPDPASAAVDRRVAEVGVYRGEIFADSLSASGLAPLPFHEIVAEDPSFTLRGGVVGDTIDVASSGPLYVLFVTGLGGRSLSLDSTPRLLHTALEVNGELASHAFGHVVNDPVEGTRRAFPADGGVLVLQDGDALRFLGEVSSSPGSDVQRFGNDLQLVVLDRTWDWFRATLGTESELPSPVGLVDGAFQPADWTDLQEVDARSFAHAGGAITFARPGHYLVVANARFRVDSPTNDRMANVVFQICHPDVPTGTREVACTLVAPEARTLNTLLMTIVDVQDTATELVLQAQVKGREDTGTTVSMLAESSVALTRLPARADFFAASSNIRQQGATTVALLLHEETEDDPQSFDHDPVGDPATVFLKREAPYLFLGGGMIQRDPTGTADRVYGHWLWEDELDQAIPRGGFGHLNRGFVGGVDFGHAGGSSMLLVPGGFRDKGIRMFYVNESLNFDPDCDHLPGDVWMEALNLKTLLPLEASFAASETSGVAPLTVDFTDLSPGAIEQWVWKFGDGGTATEINPEHTYTTPGTYTVSLQVLGHGDGDVTVQEGLIVVQ